MGDGGGGTVKLEKDMKTENQLPQWVQDAGKSNYDKAASIAARPYESYTGERVAGFGNDQTSGFDKTRQAAGLQQTGMQDAGNLFRQAGQGAAGNIGFESMLGGAKPEALDSYMNPFLKNVLDPQLRGIREQGQVARNALGAQAASAGAFGDARHGIAEANQFRDENTAVSDAIGNAQAAAFNSATGLRSQDLARQMGQQQANAGLQEQAYGRQMQAGNALAGLDAQRFGLTNQQAQALLGIGALQQQNQQQRNDVGYQNFLEQRGWDAQNIQFLQNALKNTPYNTTQWTHGFDTQQQQGGGGGGAGGIFGSLLGGLTKFI